MGTATHFFAFAPEAFRTLTLGEQTALVATVERGIEAGDQVVVREWRQGAPGDGSSGSYTPLWLCRRVTHVMRRELGLAAGFVIVCLNTSAENEWATTALKRKLSLAERQGVSPDRFWRLEERRARAKIGILRTGSTPEDESA